MSEQGSKGVPNWLKIVGACLAALVALGILGMTPWPTKSEVQAVEAKSAECCDIMQQNQVDNKALLKRIVENQEKSCHPKL